MRGTEQQTILVTGSTDGLGRALATELAERKATVLLHGRDRKKGAATLGEISDATGNERLRLHLADLGSLNDVRGLATTVLAEYERLDVLVNNAGIGTGRGGGGKRDVSADGIELRFAVNYLAPFLLARQLEPLLVNSAPARIVNVSSAGQAPIDFDDVMLEQSYSGVQAYCQSKLALVMFTFDLAEELEGTGVTTNCLHPGTYMPTNMVRQAGVDPMTPLEDGIAATMRLIGSPEVEGINGHYFDGTNESAPHPQAENPEVRRRLREISADLTGIEVPA